MKKIFSKFVIFTPLLFLFGCGSVPKKVSEISEPELRTFPKFREKKWKDNEGFSIAVIPDSQSYIDLKHQTFNWKPYVINQWEIYYRQTAFIAENAVSNGGDFSFALHVGDHVEKCADKPMEWSMAVKGLENLDGKLPLLTVPGNHDYDRWKIGKQIEGSVKYNESFGPSSKFFKNKEWYKGSSKEGRNSWAIFDAAGRKILVIALEVNPDQESVFWAQNIINNNKGLPTIILTHAYLKVSQEKTDKNQPDKIEENNESEEAENSLKKAEKAEAEYVITNNYRYIKGRNFKFSGAHYREAHDGWSAKELWENFISKNNQIFLVVCGHSGTSKTGSAYRIDKNQDGYSTYTVLSNFQYFNNYLDEAGISYSKKHKACGDGWFSILDVDFENNKIDLSCFNSETGSFMKGEPFEMTFPIDWDWEERFTNSSKQEI
ncbi:MAG: metallophosphoesterase [Treponema sp.]|nr:metallophosphoesterase [Treponema sp.]